MQIHEILVSSYSNVLFYIREMDGYKSSWLVGSSLVRGVQAQDIDTIICIETSDKTEVLKELRQNIEHAFANILHRCEILDDAVRIQFERQLPLSLAIYPYTELKEKLHLYTQGQDLDGFHKPWAAGYWLPEALCGDIFRSEPVWESDEVYETFRSLVMPYPLPLQKAIMYYGRNEIVLKYKLYLQSTCNLEKGILISDIQKAAIRYLFAKAGVYLRGFKNIERQLQLNKFHFDEKHLAAVDILSSFSYIPAKLHLIKNIIEKEDL